MGADEFILRASGLYVPPLIGLAVNPLGRFQPCGEGNCCEGGGIFCGNCNGDDAPAEWAITIGGVINGTGFGACDNDCAALNDTYIIGAGGTPCTWEKFSILIDCDFFGNTNVYDIFVTINSTVTPGVSKIIVFVDGGAGGTALFEEEFPGDCLTLDIDVPLISGLDASCDLSAATCHATAV